ncbi:MAG: hypothetical protein IJU37_06770 [Desulfovibrio sp.]|nr:hypothetical protein [Desulfovibrio sp.]
MPQEQEKFQHAVFSVLEAVMFENWLRFYFISEKPDAPADKDGQKPLFVAVPDKGMQRIKELYPHLLPLAEEVNGKEITFEISRAAVCNFVLLHLDGKIMERNTAAMIFDSTLFQVHMQLFHTWVQVHEDQLDREFLDFGAWRNLFDQWRESKAARDLAEKLFLSLQR